MLKIISANVNGIRSAYKKGFYEYIAASGADIVCVQELKAQEADLSDDMKIRTVCTLLALRRKARLQRRGGVQQTQTRQCANRHGH